MATSRTLYELTAFLRDPSGKRTPFYLRILDPINKTDASKDFFCRVHAPQLFRTDKDIYGVDAIQARELAFQFANEMLKGKDLVDQNGEPVFLSHKLST